MRKKAIKNGHRASWTAYISTEFSSDSACAFYIQRLNGLRAMLEHNGAELVAVFACHKVDWKAQYQAMSEAWKTKPRCTHAHSAQLR